MGTWRMVGVTGRYTEKERRGDDMVSTDFITTDEDYLHAGMHVSQTKLLP